MNEPHIDHEEATIASFRRDPAFAAEYLNAVIEDGTQEEIMTAFRRVAEAFGMKQIADSARLNPKNSRLHGHAPGGHAQACASRSFIKEPLPRWKWQPT